MIFHIPVENTIAYSSVDDNMELYNKNSTYTDGTLVEHDNAVYSVTNYQDLDYDTYSESTLYEIGDKVLYAGKVFEKFNPDLTFSQKYSNSDNRNPNPSTGVTPSILDAIGYGAWSGNTDDTATVIDTSGAYSTYTTVSFSNVDKTGLPYYCVADVTYTEYVDGSVNSTTSATGVYIYYNLHKDKIITGALGLDGSFYVLNQAVDVSPINTEKWYQVNTNKHQLTYIRPLDRDIPLDTKQYTVVKSEDPLTWEITLQDSANAIALGNIKGDHVIITFKDPNQNTFYTATYALPTSKINLTIGKTIIIYIPGGINILKNFKMNIQINGTDNQIGIIMPTNYIDVGATNLKFKHTVKNFDRVKISDISGYYEYYKGNRVINYKGSFDIPITDYDDAVEMDKEFSQELIAIDGSDTTDNTPSDSINIFASTKLIGRVKTLTHDTTTNKYKNSIDNISTVSFEFEEVV